MTIKTAVLAGLITAGAVALLSPAFAADPAASDGDAATGVTSDMLLNAGSKAEAGNWLMVNKTYDSNRFSPLDQITPDNVSGLKLAFAVPLGGLEPDAGGVGALEGSPLAKDGFLYVSDAWGTPYKIDATSGKVGQIVWICDTGIDKDPSSNALLANRGLALWHNLVITNLVDGRVVACDDSTGKVVWQTKEGDQPADTFDAAPLVVNNEIIVGQANGDSATRGFLAALDAKTGKELWRFYTVPSPDQPGGDTWKCAETGNPDCWKTGGAALWATGSYDPSNNTLYWGTGNPVPMMDPQYRPGRNLYSDSTIAVDATTGKLKWYFQYTPGDYHDYDEVGAQQLVDVTINGEKRKVLAHFGRNGLFYTLDRTNGSFLAAAPYVNKLTWTKGIDPKTGEPVEFDPNKDLQSYEGVNRRGGADVTTCPHIQGGMNYWPSAVDPSTGMAYGAGVEGCSDLKVTAVAPKDVHPGQSFFGGSFTDVGRTTGSLFAYDVATGKQVAKHQLPFPNYSGVALTPGLVWAGTMDGTFGAYDTKTLEPKWTINIGNTIQAPPIIYSVGGKEYVAFLAGSTGVAAFGYPMLKNRPANNMLFVFSL
jgi:alcohol dehydrogenase (cytochrome c)